MVSKKSAGKPISRSRVSQASRLLSSAVRSTVPVPLLDEPWRKKKQSGKKQR